MMLRASLESSRSSFLLSSAVFLTSPWRGTDRGSRPDWREPHDDCYSSGSHAINAEGLITPTSQRGTDQLHVLTSLLGLFTYQNTR